VLLFPVVQYPYPNPKRRRRRRRRRREEEEKENSFYYILLFNIKKNKLLRTSLLYPCIP
jgi:hypothetical protein